MSLGKSAYLGEAHAMCAGVLAARGVSRAGERSGCARAPFMARHDRSPILRKLVVCGGTSSSVFFAFYTSRVTHDTTVNVLAKSRSLISAADAAAPRHLVLMLVVRTAGSIALSHPQYAFSMPDSRAPLWRMLM